MLYEYECDKCGNKFDEFKSYAERNSVKCPICKNQAKKLVSGTRNFISDGIVKDSKGTPIWFPKDGRPYYDRFLGKTIRSKREKQQIMKEQGVVMDGSSSPERLPLEAGDMRNKSYRKQLRMED